MKNKYFLLTILTLAACTRQVDKVTPVDTLAQTTPIKESENEDIFDDKYFPLINIDSIDEDMLLKKTGDREYLDIFTRLKTAHYTFFNFRNVEGEFFEEHYFLISKQKILNNITPIIVHSSGDFNYYTAYLHTLDTNNNKIDSTPVSHEDYETGGDEPYSYVGKTKSKFKDNFITTTILKYKLFDNDSTVTTDSTIVYKEIMKNGIIKVIKTDKVL
jgi:hypothetical protein